MAFDVAAVILVVANIEVVEDVTDVVVTVVAMDFAMVEDVIDIAVAIVFAVVADSVVDGFRGKRRMGSSIKKVKPLFSP